MGAGLCHLCLGGPAQRPAEGYGIDVCQGCWSRAVDGWPKPFEPTLLAALGREGLLIPDRTAKGLLPRVYAPPADFAL